MSQNDGFFDIMFVKNCLNAQILIKQIVTQALLATLDKISIVAWPN